MNTERSCRAIFGISRQSTGWSHIGASLQAVTTAIVGIDAVAVDVEVDANKGLPGFHLVGLANNAVREGSVRIRTAIANSAFKLGHKRVTVNLAPADLPKVGAAFDLPIAIATLVTHRELTLKQNDLMLAGELALDGKLRPIRGVLSIAELAKKHGFRGLIVPQQNAAEAALLTGLAVYSATSLKEAADIIAGRQTPPYRAPVQSEDKPDDELDFADIRGLTAARRAAEVAAAGGHNLLLIGPPGSGKTMVARRIPSIIPFANRDEALQTTKIHSIAGLLDANRLTRTRPFRSPHHSCSAAGLVGGGSPPTPGEVSLANHGVLFLDELPEFSRHVLESLRQPLEDGFVTIVRANHSLRFPAQFMLVAAMNPCPCGYRGSKARSCRCGNAAADRYRGPYFRAATRSIRPVCRRRQRFAARTVF